MSDDPAIPEPREAYQRKLKAFIAEVPPVGGELVAGAPPLPTPFKQADIDALKITPDQRFTRLTGYDHKGLLQKWLVDKTTTCNDFCTKCANAMGYSGQKAAGSFDIADWLNGRGMGHVWVPAGSKAVPDYGDIFRLFAPSPDHNEAPLNHMAVSLHVSGTRWFTVEGGQGGPRRGVDSIKRRVREWKPSELQGWISMKALLSAGEPLLYWLGGWWEVEEGPYETYYYHFAAGGKISCETTRPASITGAPVAASLVGRFTVKGMYGLQIAWRSDDVDETLTLVAQDQEKRLFRMEGKTARGYALSARRLLPPKPG